MNNKRKRDNDLDDNDENHRDDKRKRDDDLDDNDIKDRLEIKDRDDEKNRDDEKDKDAENDRDDVKDNDDENDNNNNNDNENDSDNKNDSDNNSNDDSALSTDMENANVDGLRMRIMHHKNNLDFCESIIDNLKTVKEYIQKTEDGTITEEDARKFEEMKSENEINDLIYRYDDSKSLVENVDEEISQNEDRMRYMRGRIELYEKRADRAEADSDSDSSSGNMYDVDFDEMDLDSDNEMNQNDNNSTENNNENPTDDNQSPTEYIAELEESLPGDFIGGGDD